MANVQILYLICNYLCTREMKTESEWVALGHECRRRLDWKGAIENYNKAIEMNPESEAREAKIMVMEILNFGNLQIYNV